MANLHTPFAPATDYVILDGSTVIAIAPNFKDAAIIQHTRGGRIRLNGRDFVLTPMTPGSLGSRIADAADKRANIGTGPDRETRRAAADAADDLVALTARNGGTR